MRADWTAAGCPAGTSDAAIVSGLFALLLRVYSGRSPDEIVATDPVFRRTSACWRRCRPTAAMALPLWRARSAHSPRCSGADASGATSCGTGGARRHCRIDCRGVDFDLRRGAGVHLGGISSRTRPCQPDGSAGGAADRAGPGVLRRAGDGACATSACQTASSATCGPSAARRVVRCRPGSRLRADVDLPARSDDSLHLGSWQ